MARRLQDLPLLREKFAEGALSLDQVDAISQLATLETEEAVISECLGLSMRLPWWSAPFMTMPGLLVSDADPVWFPPGCVVNCGIEMEAANSLAVGPDSSFTPIIGPIGLIGDRPICAI